MKPIFLFAFVIIAIHANGQGNVSRLSGKVCDESMRPLSKVKVTVKGVDYETTTNEKGTYMLVLPGVHKGTCIYSCKGYKTKKVAFAHTPLSNDIQLEKEETDSSDKKIKDKDTKIND